jgi:hypothetical protein
MSVNMTVATCSSPPSESSLRRFQMVSATAGIYVAGEERHQLLALLGGLAGEQSLLHELQAERQRNREEHGELRREERQPVAPARVEEHRHDRADHHQQQQARDSVAQLVEEQKHNLRRPPTRAGRTSQPDRRRVNRPAFEQRAHRAGEDVGSAHALADAVLSGDAEERREKGVACRVAALADEDQLVREGLWRDLAVHHVHGGDVGRRDPCPMRR